MNRLDLYSQYTTTRNTIILTPGVSQVLSTGRCKITAKTNIESADILVTETSTGKTQIIRYGQPSTEVIGASAITLGPLPQTVEVESAVFDKIVELDSTSGEVVDFGGTLGGGGSGGGEVSLGALITDASTNSVAIQSAIDAANAAGGGTVTLPAGTYYVTPQFPAIQTVFLLRSGVVIQSQNTKLRLTGGTQCSIFRNAARHATPVTATLGYTSGYTATLTFPDATHGGLNLVEGDFISTEDVSFSLVNDTTDAAEFLGTFAVRNVTTNVVTIALDREPMVGKVIGTYITAGGTGYTNSTLPTVSFATGGGRTASGFVQVQAGVVTNVEVIDPGTGYVSAPAITFSNGAATATAVIGTKPASLKVFKSDRDFGIVGNLIYDPDTAVNLKDITGTVNRSAEDCFTFARFYHAVFEISVQNTSVDAADTCRETLTVCNGRRLKANVQGGTRETMKMYGPFHFADIEASNGRYNSDDNLSLQVAEPGSPANWRQYSVARGNIAQITLHNINIKSETSGGNGVILYGQSCMGIVSDITINYMHGGRENSGTLNDRCLSLAAQTGTASTLIQGYFENIVVNGMNSTSEFCLNLWGSAIVKSITFNNANVSTKQTTNSALSISDFSLIRQLTWNNLYVQPNQNANNNFADALFTTFNSLQYNCGKAFTLFRFYCPTTHTFTYDRVVTINNSICEGGQFINVFSVPGGKTTFNINNCFITGSSADFTIQTDNAAVFNIVNSKIVNPNIAAINGANTGTHNKLAKFNIVNSEIQGSLTHHVVRTVAPYEISLVNSSLQQRPGAAAPGSYMATLAATGSIKLSGSNMKFEQIGTGTAPTLLNLFAGSTFTANSLDFAADVSTTGIAKTNQSKAWHTGATNPGPAYADGTNWRNLATNSIIV